MASRAGRLRASIGSSRHFLSGFGVLVILVVIFGIARPQTFLTLATARSVLELSAVPVIFAVGVTTVLIAHEFDLSFTAVAGAASAVSVILMVDHGVNPLLACLAAMLLGATVGLINGSAVRFLRLPSLVATLAMTSIAAAIELAIAGNRQIFTGIPKGFVDFSRREVVFGLSTSVFIAIAIVAVFTLIATRTVFGRHLEAIGGNSEAAQMAGIPVTSRIVTAFVIAGSLAALGGLVMTSKATAYYPDAVGGALLPAYTAAFLGLIFDRHGRFNMVGSAFGVVLLTVMQSGLTIWNQPGWAASLIQGIVLIAAVASFQLRQRKA